MDEWDELLAFISSCSEWRLSEFCSSIVLLIKNYLCYLQYRGQRNFRQRFGISDVCRSVAEANMGGGFCIKAVTRYAVLCDVHVLL